MHDQGDQDAESRRDQSGPDQAGFDQSGPDPIDIVVGARIKKRRLDLGMTQERLAEALGITFQQVQKYERAANRVSASRLFKIAEVLKVAVGWLFNEPAPQRLGAAEPGDAFIHVDGVLQEQLGWRETHDLVRAYWRIASEKQRRSVYELTFSLAAPAPEPQPEPFARDTYPEQG